MSGTCDLRPSSVSAQCEWCLSAMLYSHFVYHVGFSCYFSKQSLHGEGGLMEMDGVVCEAPPGMEHM